MANGNGVDPVAVEMGRRIAELRVARDWTQRELAQATGWNEQDADDSAAKGLSPSRIANYEQGTRRVGHEEAEILAGVFSDFPPAYFLCAEREARVLNALRHDLPKSVANRP